MSHVFYRNLFRFPTFQNIQKGFTLFFGDLGFRDSPRGSGSMHCLYLIYLYVLFFSLFFFQHPHRLADATPFEQPWQSKHWHDPGQSPTMSLHMPIPTWTRRVLLLAFHFSADSCLHNSHITLCWESRSLEHTRAPTDNWKRVTRNRGSVSVSPGAQDWERRRERQGCCD